MIVLSKSVVHVLLVEDDADICEIAVLALELDDCMRVSVAHTGASAIAALMSAPMPDAILLDANLPDMSGIAVAEASKQRGDTPIIFLTASVRAADHTAYYNAGGIGVIAKPLDPLSLADTVRRMLAAGPQRA